MRTLFVKGAGLLLMIALGYFLKRRRLFCRDDARILSKIIMNLTLPGALIASFGAFRLETGLLLAVGIGLLSNAVALLLAAMMTRRRPGPERALYMLNAPGYNIGTFVLPFVQSFLPPEGLIGVSMFDAGNSLFNCGGTYAITASVIGGRRPTVRDVLDKMLHSVPFVTILTVLTLGLLGISIPEDICAVAGMFGQANAFLAMLMIGILLEPRIPRESRGDVLRIVLFRYSFGLAAAVLCWLLLPLPVLVRQVLALSLLAPVPSVALVYCEQCGCDMVTVGAVHSLCIPISLVFTLLISFLGVL